MDLINAPTSMLFYYMGVACLAVVIFLGLLTAKTSHTFIRARDLYYKTNHVYQVNWGGANISQICKAMRALNKDGTKATVLSWKVAEFKDSIEPMEKMYKELFSFFPKVFFQCNGMMIAWSLFILVVFSLFPDVTASDIKKGIGYTLVVTFIGNVWLFCLFRAYREEISHCMCHMLNLKDIYSYALLLDTYYLYRDVPYDVNTLAMEIKMRVFGYMYLNGDCILPLKDNVIKVNFGIKK